MLGLINSREKRQANIIQISAFKRAKAKTLRKYKLKKNNPADLEIPLPEPDDAPNLWDSNHPLCKHYMQCCPDASDCNKVLDYACDQRRLMLCQNKPSRYHSDNTTPVQYCNDAVVDAISCKQHNSSAIQKHTNELKLNLKKLQTKKSSIPRI